MRVQAGRKDHFCALAADDCIGAPVIVADGMDCGDENVDDFVVSLN